LIVPFDYLDENPAAIPLAEINAPAAVGDH
jgi:hypothetical protein